MLIRTEAPSDILIIDQLLKTVFDTDAEANLVKALRENGQLTLSLVACSDEGEVIGHVMFSPVTLNGQDMLWQGLAPLAVAKHCQGQGIAKALVQEAFEILPELGYPACVVLGDPNYYQQFQFESASLYGLKCQWEVPEGAFQVRSLVEEPMTVLLEGQSGVIEYSGEFDQF